MPSTQRPAQPDAFDGVGHVVLQALAALAPLGEATGMVRKPLESFVARMYEAALVASAGSLHDVVRDMRRARIPEAVVAEVYVPLVARRLGLAWVADEIDFVAVTIGAARLQMLVRRLDRAGSDAQRAAERALLVGVPEGVQHTLGAAVLAGHLRSRGCFVHLDLELTPESIAEQVGKGEFAGVFLSIAQLDQVESFRNLIETSKRTSRDTPVVIGGALLGQHLNIGTLTGADLATCDVDEAMRHCDVRAPVGADPVAQAVFIEAPQPRVRPQRGVGK